jgi:hypothetical protein
MDNSSFYDTALATVREAVEADNKGEYEKCGCSHSLLFELGYSYGWWFVTQGISPISEGTGQVYRGAEMYVQLIMACFMIEACLELRLPYELRRELLDYLQSRRTPRGKR